MANLILKTDNSPAQMFIRLALGAVILPHGAQKALGWFGGHGLEGTLNFFTQSMGMPLAVAVLVIAAEFLGPIGLFFGFLTRLAALGIACVMGGAIAMVHLQHGFFMNWQGDQAGEGFEYHLLAIAIAVALMIKGGGKWSLDGVLSRNR